MLVLAIAALAASAVMAYVIGMSVVAPKDSFLRSKRGLYLLVIGALTFVLLPPQLPSTGSIVEDAGQGMLPSLAWPESLGTGTYLVLWVVTTLAALLVGMRIWKAGSPDWRPGARVADASATGRVAGLLPLADTLPAALDVLVAAGVRERDLAHAANDIRRAGSRLALGLPPSDGALYAMVAAKLPPSTAAAVTGYLLEGAGRRSAGH